jgi:hypothetical protein
MNRRGFFSRLIAGGVGILAGVSLVKAQNKGKVDVYSLERQPNGEFFRKHYQFDKGPEYIDLEQALPHLDEAVNVFNPDLDYFYSNNVISLSRVTYFGTKA